MRTNKLKQHVFHLLRSVACVLTCFAITACHDKTPELGDIAGTVKDHTGHAIQNATVSLSPGGASRHTNSEGYYIFENLAPQDYTVTATADGFITDTRSVLVEIEKTKTVDFTLQPDHSELEVDLNHIDFETQITTKTLNLSNTGHATLNWSLSKQIDWLSCTPSSGTLRAGDTQGITFRADRSKLQKGTKTDKVVITSNGGSVEITVRITVTGIDVSWSPSELDFGSTQSVMALSFSGGNDVSYTLTPSNSWIIPSKRSGTFSRTENLTVSVKREGLSEGGYEGHITIRVGDQSATIPVRMSIQSKEKPTSNMIQVKDINDHSATFQGAVVSIGSSQILHHGFCWSSTTQTPEQGTSESCDYGDTNQARNMEYTAHNLTPGTTYWVCVYAENSDGVGYSQSIKFTTDELPQVPQVTTGNVSDIKAGSARLMGEILKLGARGGITQHGHVWSLYPNPTAVDAHTTLGATEATGVFFSDLTGLAPATTYHVRAYATNSVGTNYGDDVTFTTLPDAMTLTTSAATAITHEEATLGGEITYDGGNKVTESGVCIGLDINPTVSATCFAASTQNATFTVKATGLQSQTTYHARAYAKTESGAAYYGNDITFTTAEIPRTPQVATGTVSELKPKTAKMSGQIIEVGNRGGITQHGHVWSAYANPTTNDMRTELGAASAASAFVSSLTSLSPATTYHVRAYATYAGGTVYGDDYTFTTPPDAMTLTTASASGVTYKAATLGGEITYDGGNKVTERGVCIGPAANPTVSTTCFVASTQNAAFTVKATGLEYLTTYHARAYAKTESGVTYYGNDITFTTADKPEGSHIDGEDYEGENDWNN